MFKRKKFIFAFLILCSFLFLHGESCVRNYMYGEQFKDYFLDGFQIYTVLTKGLEACFQKCLRHGLCESINFENSKEPLSMCDLNSQRPSKSHQLIYRPGYVFVKAEKQVSYKSGFFNSLSRNGF